MFNTARILAQSYNAFLSLLHFASNLYVLACIFFNTSINKLSYNHIITYRYHHTALAQLQNSIANNFGWEVKVKNCLWLETIIWQARGQIVDGPVRVFGGFTPLACPNCAYAGQCAPIHVNNLCHKLKLNVRLKSLGVEFSPFKTMNVPPTREICKMFMSIPIKKALIAKTINFRLLVIQYDWNHVN